MAYSGNIATIPLGDKGIITDLPVTQRPPDSLQIGENITLENGLVEKARGGLRYNLNALSSGIVSIFDWFPDTDNSRQRLIAVTDDGSVFRDIGDREFSGGTAIATGLGPLTPNVDLVSGGQEIAGNTKKLFFFTEGKNQLKVLEGDNTELLDIDAPAADWVTPNFPKVGIIHQNRLWAFQGQRAYASDTANHEDFTTNFLTQNIFPGEGGEIKGCYVFKGRLFAFKDGGFVYYLDDANEDSSLWFWRKLASNFGLASPHGVLDALNDMLAMNNTGTITSYAATDALGDIESADIFRNAQMEQYIHESLNKSGLPFTHAIYYAEKKQAFFTYRMSARSNNDMILVIDVGKALPRIYIQNKGTPQCLALRKDGRGIERPVYGSSDGYVVLMDREDRLEATASFTGKFRTAPLDMRFLDASLGSKEKHWDFLAVEYMPEGNWDLSCDYFIDGKYVDTITFKMSADPNDQLDNMQLDIDRIAGANSETRSKRLTGTGRVIEFEFTQGGSNQNFRIPSISVGFRPGAERQLRRS